MLLKRSVLRRRTGRRTRELPESIVLELILIIILVSINAFLAASEISVVTTRKARIEHLAEQGNRAAQALLRLLGQPSRFLATIQVGLTISSLFASALGAVSLVVVLTHLLAGVTIRFIADNASGIALVLVTLFISFITIVFGELVPKNVAILNPERFALAVARPIEILSRITAPMVSLLSLATDLVLAPLGVERRVKVPSVTQEELQAMVEAAEEEGLVEASERAMIQGVFDFGDTRAREVMVPRLDITGLACGSSLRQGWEKIMLTGYSRLPVFDEDLDHIVGVLYAKDLLRAMGQPQPPATVDAIMRPPVFTPETKRVDELLRELRASRSHIAIVADEFGGTAGLVTMEDLIEEIIGPIQDEFEGEETEIEMVGPGEAVVRGSYSISDLNDALDLELEAEGVDTVGGLVYTTLGRIPEPGDRAELEDATLTVLATRGPRILRVRVTKKE